MKKILTGVFVLVLSLSAPALASDCYSVDPVHSTVIFRISHLGVCLFQGRFNDLSGSIFFDGQKPENSNVNLTVAADSVDTDNIVRDNDLKSENFFNVKKYPAITFISNKVTPKDNGTYDVSGKLTLLGVTKPITVEAKFIGKGTDPKGGERAGFFTTFTILRSDFGMTYDPPPLLGNEVTLTIGAEGLIEKKKEGK